MAGAIHCAGALAHFLPCRSPCQGVVQAGTASTGALRLLRGKERAWVQRQRTEQGLGREMRRRCRSGVVEPLDLTEENIEKVLVEARTELLQLFDDAVGITGVAELADVDGPFVTLRLRGRFWHQRSMVLARLASFLRSRIPEILEVNIEDPSQLDDSAANF